MKSESDDIGKTEKREEFRVCVQSILDTVNTTLQKHGVYKFNLTNLQEIPGGISRKIQDMFALLRPAKQCTESTTLPKYIAKT